MIGAGRLVKDGKVVQEIYLLEYIEFNRLPCVVCCHFMHVAIACSH